MFSTAVSGGSQLQANASLLLTDRSESLKIGLLEKSLVDVTGQSPHVYHFDELSTSSVDDKIWIVLAFESFSLLQPSESQFVALQSVLLGSQGILWVTRGARGCSPEASMIDGLARVIRSENAGVKLVTLDLDDSPGLPDIEAASLISRVYAHVFASENASTVEDQEFDEEKGLIHIRRVLVYVNKDRYIMRETTQPVPEPQPFIQNGRDLRLKLGTPGLLDSIYFEDDPKSKQLIADDEVEVEIKATGVRRTSTFTNGLTDKIALDELQGCHDRAWPNTVLRHRP